MTIPSTQQIDAFVNALQLSIESQIVSYTHTANNELRIHLDKSADDKKLELFQKIFGFNQIGLNKIMLVCLEAEQIEVLTNFLLLTRLEPVSLKFLAESKDESVPPFMREKVEKLYVPQQQEGVLVQNLTDASRCIFTVLKQKKMTMRELSGLTGLTQASLHHFKRGKDIKLSNLIKVAKALGLTIKLN